MKRFNLTDINWKKGVLTGPEDSECELCFIPFCHRQAEGQVTSQVSFLCQLPLMQNCNYLVSAAESVAQRESSIPSVSYTIPAFMFSVCSLNWKKKNQSPSEMRAKVSTFCSGSCVSASVYACLWVSGRTHTNKDIKWNSKFMKGPENENLIFLLLENRPVNFKTKYITHTDFITKF